jgi:putative component of toxin-antitoxin plasmid stabilization module
LFGGGTKKKQQADIERAKELYKEYKERKKKFKQKKR